MNILLLLKNRKKMCDGFEFQYNSIFLLAIGGLQVEKYCCIAQHSNQEIGDLHYTISFEYIFTYMVNL